MPKVKKPVSLEMFYLTEQSKKIIAHHRPTAGEEFTDSDILNAILYEFNRQHCSIGWSTIWSATEDYEDD